MNPFVSIGVSLIFCATALGDRTASPGEQAPDLENVRWIHGEPVERFETGRVYVLEFWSTWCSACIGSIDHLNELAHRYKADATFIAIHIWQRESAPKPALFLAKRQKAAKPVWSFSVVEDMDDILAKIWMDATDNGGLPTTMIVNRASKLAWFGHTKDLDKPLKAIVERRFDSRRGVAGMNRRIRVGRKANESGQAIERGDYAIGMSLMLEALREDPDTVAEWIPSTYGHLLHVSQSQETAASFVHKVLATQEGKKTDLLVGFARVILNFRSSEMCDLILALELAEKANKMSLSKNPHTLSTLATIRAELNDIYGAIKAIELAIINAANKNQRESFLGTLADFRKRTQDG